MICKNSILRSFGLVNNSAASPLPFRLKTNPNHCEWNCCLRVFFVHVRAFKTRTLSRADGNKEEEEETKSLTS